MGRPKRYFGRFCRLFVIVNHTSHEADGFSLLCADALVENDHLLRAPEADEPGQQPGHAAVRRKADRTISGREMGRLRSQHNIRSEEHTSEIQSLMRISYAVFCLKKKKKQTEQ